VGLQFRAPRGTYPCAAWALDLPGCFVWGQDEADALSRLPAAIMAYVDFMERHRVALPAEAPYGEVAVVERFQCWWDSDYEVDPTFFTDEGAVSAADVVFIRDALLATRPELLAAADAAGEGRAGERTVDEMLHHVATAEWFYGSRLEEDPRSVWGFARREETDPRRRLAAVRDWTLARLESLPELGPLERIHRGERWTPRKLLRRYLYHELDHLLELRARASSVVEVG
jgi:predicted RNase H-like HicB family nuclease